MAFLRSQASPNSVAVTSRDKRRIALQDGQVKGTPLLVPNSMKSAPSNQYAGFWMRDSSKVKGNQDYKFIERVLEFKEAQISYFCKFFKLEQEGITQVIRFVSCIKDDELAVKVNALINYIKSWPNPDQMPKPAHPKQQKSIYSLRNEGNNAENSPAKKNSFFRSSSSSPQDSLPIGSSTQSSPNSYSQSSTPIYSQNQNQNSFFRSSPPNTNQNRSFAPISSNIYIANDIRYSEIREITRIPIQDVTEVAFSFPTNNQHFFLSLTGTGNIRNLIQWPTELQIWINGFLIKPLGTVLNSNFIDITDFSPKALKISNHAPINQIFISIIGASFRSYDQIIENIGFVDMNGFSMGNNSNQNSGGLFTVNTSYNITNQESQVPHADCMFCPFTGKLMKFPGRGIHCNHYQCFDIKTFLKVMNRCGRKFCPICQRIIELNELVISKFALDEVRRIHPANPSTILSGIQETVTDERNANNDNDADSRIISFGGDDFENDQTFPDTSEPFSFEMNNFGGEF